MLDYETIYELSKMSKYMLLMLLKWFKMQVYYLSQGLKLISMLL